MELNEFTYSDMKKPHERENMLSFDIASLGTKSGGYGMFYEKARVVTLLGASLIIKELELMCKEEGLDFDSVLEFSPTLRKLIK